MSNDWAGLTYLQSGRSVKKWEDLLSIAEDKGWWIFRGQGSASHTLMSSLERCSEQLGTKVVYAYDVETTVIREFVRRFHHYSSYNPLNEIEWLSIMRHYGAPTRLIDWTYSLYIAAYFALEQCKKDEDSAIWAVDLTWLHDKCRKNIKPQKGSRPKKRIDRIFWEKPKDLSEVFGDKKTPWVAPVNSLNLNERVSIQLGVFLAPCDLSISFMKNLAALTSTSDHVQKYVIPYRVRNEFLKRLHHMNISRASLFPGLDGFAESLGVYSPTVMKVSLGESKDLMTCRRRTFL